jgi:hypothetical protein
VADRDALSSRLDALENYLAELRSFQSVRHEEFVREPALHHLAERREPHLSIAGRMKIHGDIFDSAPEEDWQSR